MNEGYNVAWVSTHLDGADGALPADYGRIMLQRFEVPLDPLGNPGAPVAGGIDGIAGLDNPYGTGDAAIWIGDENADAIGGAFGRNPSTAALHSFETGVVWIEQDGAGASGSPSAPMTTWARLSIFPPAPTFRRDSRSRPAPMRTSFRLEQSTSPLPG